METAAASHPLYSCCWRTLCRGQESRRAGVQRCRVLGAEEHRSNSDLIHLLCHIHLRRMGRNSDSQQSQNVLGLWSHIWPDLLLLRSSVRVRIRLEHQRRTDHYNDPWMFSWRNSLSGLEDSPGSGGNNWIHYVAGSDSYIKTWPARP